MDYLSGGPDVAIKSLGQGISEAFLVSAKKGAAKFENVLRQFLSNGRSFKFTEHLCSFILDQNFADMGVKSVGLVCERVRDLKRRDSPELPDLSDKLIIGFQKVPDFIPGVGKIEMQASKVSFRIGKNCPFKDSAATFFTAAVREINGLVDAVHPEAGAGVISAGEEDILLGALSERII